MDKRAISSKLLAIDPSLKASGWVLFDIQSETPISAGIISPPGPSLSLAERLLCLQADVNRLLNDLNMGENDFLICEGPAPLVLNPISSIKVEHVRGIFETVARSISITVPGRINPRTVQIELIGLKGRQIERKEVKRAAYSIAERLYGNKLKDLTSKPGAVRKISQDIIDAALIGTLAVSRIKMCERAGISVFTAFSEGNRSFKRSGRKGVRWQESDLK